LRHRHPLFAVLLLARPRRDEPVPVPQRRFHNIVNDFGRPPVQHWRGVDFHRGAATKARTATRRTTPYTKIAVFSERHDFFAHATGIDPRGWQLVEFTLWPGEPPPGTEGTRYDVLHRSTPEL
jgi:hypothetical protein